MMLIHIISVLSVMMDNVLNEIHIKRYPAKTLRIVMYDVKYLRW